MTVVPNQGSEINSLLSQNCELITLSISFLLLVSITYCHVPLLLTTFSQLVLYSHTVTFSPYCIRSLSFSCLVCWLTKHYSFTWCLSVALSSLLTKSLVYLFVAFSVDRCDVTLAASYLLSDSIAILCRLPSVSLLLSSLLTSDRAYLLPGSSTRNQKYTP